MATDIEKNKNHTTESIRSDSQDENGSLNSNTPPKSRYERWIKRIRINGLETRGIEPVSPAERQKPTSWSLLEMLLMWFSMGMVVNNIIVGTLGTLVMQLGYKDAAICAICGNVLGTVALGFMSTFGPRSGHRTLIIARYFMGYYPSKLCCLLNIFTVLGYGMVNCVVGGQIISKVSGDHVSVIVGIIIVAFASWLMATLGMSFFKIYERIAWLPQLLVLCVMVGTAWPQFDFQTASVGTPGEVNSKRLSFLSLCFSISLAWIPMAADYYVYYPRDTKPWKVWTVTTIGASLSMLITILIGVGLGTAVAYNSQWADIYDGTPGGILVAAYHRLGSFGSFCAIVNVVAVISGNGPSAYSMSMNFQMLGNYWLKVPRPVFTIVTTIAYAACAIGGRNMLYQIFKNFLPLIGYWIVIWLTIVIEQHLLFSRGREYDWTIWNNRQKLPMGVAAGIAFLVGWAGAIVGMDQTYFSGPLAKAAPGNCELGVWLGAGFTAVVYPPLRMLERRIIRR